MIPSPILQGQRQVDWPNIPPASLKGDHTGNHDVGVHAKRFACWRGRVFSGNMLRLCGAGGAASATQATPEPQRRRLATAEGPRLWGEL